MPHIQLNKKAFFHNLDYFSNICLGEKICIALKDNAYGHGIEEVASMANEYGIKHVFVRTLAEAIVAKKFNFESILVLYDIPKSLDSDIIISINSLNDLKKVPQHSKVELKIDTGMNRNGLEITEINKACEYIKSNDLILHGIFTHFCCSDEDNNITALQEESFQDAIKITKQFIDYKFRVHCANSTGAHKVDMSKYDIARIGIGIYGYLDIGEYEKKLKPVLSLYANKITTKNVKSGDHIGYGSDGYLVSSDMTVSNYDVGYGDGFFRLNGNSGITIATQNKPILGRISMDSFSVELEDEEVCVFNNVTKLATYHNTIKYEILTNLKSSIKRIII